MRSVPWRRRLLVWGLSPRLLGVLAWGMLVLALVHRFGFSLYYVTSRSMLPTLGVHDVLVVNHFRYRWQSPQPGDIVLFTVPNGQTYVKRLAALGGEEVELKDGEVRVQGQARQALPPGGQDYPPHLVSPGHFFALGDNRDNSADSRFIGDVPLERLVGQAQFRLWPLSRFGSL